MTIKPAELAEILNEHAKWSTGTGGRRADLKGADLRGADLKGADLKGADLGGADLRGADLSWANLRGADLRGADLRDANLSGANLSGANLRDADLSWANLSGANLRGANLSSADLSSANLNWANLSGANLNWANLSGANLNGANLNGANLSSVIGYRCPSAWVAAQEVDEQCRGIIIYKQFGLHYAPPPHWKIEVGSVLTEVVTPDRSTEYGSGINVAPRDWGGFETGRPIWRCLIEWRDLCTLVVPFQTDGKARVGRLTLLSEVEDKC